MSGDIAKIIICYNQTKVFMRNYLLLIKIWLKRIFKIRMSTKENAKYIANQKEIFFGNLSGWLHGLNEKDYYPSSSEYSPMKNKLYYYESTTVKKEKDNILEFDISTTNIKILAELNPIAEQLTFKTYKRVIDINSESGYYFSEIPDLKITFNAKNNMNRWLFAGEFLEKVPLLVKYFDAIIDHFKEKDDE